MRDKNCELCAGSGWYGDNGPGIKGNREYVPCERCNPRGEEATPDSKSDRALLEEAVKWLEFTRSKIDYCHTVITNKDIENNMTIGQLDTFLARAKEVLK